MQETTAQANDRNLSRFLYLVPGITVVIVGLTGSIFGSAWSERVYEFFAGIETMQAIGTYVPYFPFVPFFPIFLIMLGAGLIVKSRQQKQLRFITLMTQISRDA